MSITAVLDDVLEMGAVSQLVHEGPPPAGSDPGKSLRLENSLNTLFAKLEGQKNFYKIIQYWSSVKKILDYGRTIGWNMNIVMEYHSRFEKLYLSKIRRQLHWP